LSGFQKIKAENLHIRPFLRYNKRKGRGFLMRNCSAKIKLLFFVIAVLSGFLLYAAYRKEVAEIQKPFYLKRKTGKWLEKSRIVGTVKNPPKEGFGIKVYKEGGGKAVFSKDYSGGFTVYETDFLNLGYFVVEVGGAGYTSKRSKPVRLKVKSDCVVNIVFE
jgi:hypothetical protein